LSKYSLKFHETGRSDYKALPRNVKNQLKKQIPELLGKDPIACSVLLRPPLQMFRSCHIGNYRVIFYLAEDILAIAIVGIGKHSDDAKKDIYRKLEHLVTKGQLAQKVLDVLKGLGHLKLTST
jgi:mRNA-degrading endonuclease RelE of RelBE toxin-antitoxin system